MDKAPDVKTYGAYKVDPAVVFVDQNGRPHKALITNVHSMLDETTPWGVNLVYITDDANKRDSYGLQLERATSVTHKSKSGANGFYFVMASEVASVLV